MQARGPLGERQLERGPAGHERVGVVVAGLDRGGGRDDLERGARRERALDAAVQQRLVLPALELVVGARDRAEVVVGQAVGVVAGRGDHCQNLARRRLDRHDGAPSGLAESREPVVRGVLRGPVDRQPDVAALPLGVAEQVDQAGDEQPRVVAGEHVVLGALDRGLGVVGEVAGEVGVLQRQRVGALEVELVVRLDAARHRVAPGQDRAPLAGEGRLDHAAVRRVLVQAVGADVLQHGRVDHQRDEEQQRADRHDADRLVHERTAFTTWVASSSASPSAERSGTGRRAWSLMRSSNATITQFATREEPP